MSFIKTIVGPMGSGKTAELISSLIYDSGNVLAIKPDIDTRNGKFIKSRNGKMIEAISIVSPLEIPGLIEDYIEQIVIDEIHMLDESLYYVLLGIKNKAILCAGLNKGINDIPFNTTAKVMAISNEIIVLDGVCEICASRARHTRVRPGTTRKTNIGGSDIYQVVCEACIGKEK